MEIQNVTRIPIVIQAVQVTPSNVAEVAEWCKGTLTEATYKLMGGDHKMGAILLSKQGPKNDKTRTVLIGNWITKHRNSFKCWTREAYEASFLPAVPRLMAGDLVQVGTNEEVQAMRGWEGKVLDPHLVGVDFGARGMLVFEPDWLDKIDEMSSEQLQANAGVVLENNESRPVEQIIEEMRQESKDRIAAMEAENEAFDPTKSTWDIAGAQPRFKKGQRVQVLEGHEYWPGGRAGVSTGEMSEGKLAVMIDGKDSPWWFDENFLRPEFKVDNLVKITTEGEYWGQHGHIREVFVGENTRDVKVGFATADYDREETEYFFYSELELVEEKPAENLMSEDTITLNQFREQLGLDSIGEKGEKPMSPETIEYIRGLPEEERLRFVAVQKSAEEIVREELPLTLKDFAMNDMVATTAERDIDGVTLPVGTQGLVTVVGVDLPDGGEGVEVLFSGEFYGYFAPEELKKV